MDLVRETVLRRRMVEEQIRRRGIRDERVLSAMEEVPRHLFVPEEIRHRAYGDEPLPIGEGQTISQPYIVARMLELAQFQPGHRVLEIGTGSGYQTALLAGLVERVFSVERVRGLAERAQQALRAARIGSQRQQGDAAIGELRRA